MAWTLASQGDLGSYALRRTAADVAERLEDEDDEASDASDIEPGAAESPGPAAKRCRY